MREVKFDVQMRTSVPQILLDQSDDDLGLFVAVAQDLGVQQKRERLNRFHELRAIPVAQLFELRVFCPWPDRDFVDFLIDVGEIGIMHPLAYAVGNGKRSSELLGSVTDVDNPFA